MENNFIANTQDPPEIKNGYPLALRLPAQLFSYIFHPLFIPVIATWYLAFIHQDYFTGITPHDKLITVIKVAFNTVIFPGITVLLL
ncbi:MAG: hypothetical protein ACRDE8_05830, partial [Ginsengibacter sp.]